MKQQEAKLKEKMREAFAARYLNRGWSTHFPASFRAGVPDLYFVAQTKLLGRELWRRSVWIEAKVDAPVTELQKIVMCRMHDAGDNVRVVRCDTSVPKEKRLLCISAPPHFRQEVGIPWCDLSSANFWDEVLRC